MFFTTIIWDRLYFFSLHETSDSYFKNDLSHCSLRIHDIRVQMALPARISEQHSTIAPSHAIKLTLTMSPPYIVN